MCGIWRYGNANEELSIAEVTESGEANEATGRRTSFIGWW